LVAVLLISALIGGCDQQTNKSSSSRIQQVAGRFQLIPAGHSNIDGKIPIVFSAWRLDSVTGSAEFCTYDSGGEPVGTLTMPESLRCVSETPDSPNYKRGAK
jgi:hypothetical protein